MLMQSDDRTVIGVLFSHRTRRRKNEVQYERHVEEAESQDLAEFQGGRGGQH